MTDAHRTASSPAAQVLDLVRGCLARSPRRQLLVGIDGRAGSGKSTLARAVQAQLIAEGIACHVLSVDDFYLPPGEAIEGASFAQLYDRDRLVREALAPLAAGQAAHHQRLDWDVGKLVGPVPIPAGIVVLVEGVTVLADDLAPYLDASVWVEADPDLCAARGIARDGEQHRAIWENVWLPREAAWILAAAPHERADLVVDGS